MCVMQLVYMNLTGELMNVIREFLSFNCPITD